MAWKLTSTFSALLTLLIGNTFYARNIVASVLVMVWAVRIAGKGDTSFISYARLTFVYLTFRLSFIPSPENG